MPTTLDDRQTELAATAVEFYLREGIPAELMREIALGEAHDEQFTAMNDLRHQLRELVKVRQSIGRVAFDYLASISWDTLGVQQAIDTAQAGSALAVFRTSRENLNLFADVLKERADQLLQQDDVTSTDRDLAKRYMQAARTLDRDARRATA